MLDPENEEMQIIFGERGTEPGGFTKVEDPLDNDLTPMHPRTQDNLWSNNDFSTEQQ